MDQFEYPVIPTDLGGNGDPAVATRLYHLAMSRYQAITNNTNVRMCQGSDTLAALASRQGKMGCQKAFIIDKTEFNIPAVVITGSFPCSPARCAQYFMDRKIQRDRTLHPELLSLDKLEQVELKIPAVRKCYYNYLTANTALSRMGVNNIDSVDFTFQQSDPSNANEIIIMMSALHNGREPTPEFRRLQNYLTFLRFAPHPSKPNVSNFAICFCVKIEDIEETLAVHTQALRLVEQYNRMADDMVVRQF